MNEWAIVFVGLVILGCIAYIFLIDKLSPKDTWRTDAKKAIDSLSASMDDRNTYILKSHVIDADALFGDVLQRSGVKGDTVGERLKCARGRFTSEEYNKIWHAHKVRNRLVHEAGGHLSLDEQRIAFITLKSAILTLLKS